MSRMNVLCKIADEFVKKIDATPDVSSDPKKLSEIFFQHHSPHKLSIITPQSYKRISEQRSDDMPPDDLKEYIDDRIIEENKYRKILEINDEGKSFTYASVVGFNLMEDPLDYPGFTYFFHLTKEQIDKTLFGLVGNKDFTMSPELGLPALKKCLKAWKDHKDDLISYEDDILGWIDPRIEVVIPYVIIPELVIVEIEQR